MRTLILAATLLIAGCTGLVDDRQNVCTLAADHLAACTGQAAPTAEACDASAAEEANALLGLDCASVSALGAPSGRATTSSPEPCSEESAQKCDDYCVSFFDELGLRLKSTSCEVEDGTAHCQCKGYWWFW